MYDQFTHSLYVQSSKDAGCSVMLRPPLNSIFKLEDDQIYFDKFMLLLPQNRFFEIFSMS